MNLPDSEGANALVHAVECGSLELVRFLAVEGGADVNYSDEQGFGAVTVAAYLGHTAIGKLRVALVKGLGFGSVSLRGWVVVMCGCCG